MFWIHQSSSVWAFVSYLFPIGLQPENEAMNLLVTKLKKRVYFHFHHVKRFTCSAQPSVLHLE